MIAEHVSCDRLNSGPFATTMQHFPCRCDDVWISNPTWLGLGNDHVLA